MKYKISIIIPIYNVEKYIEDCLLSVANQTLSDGLECILIDDCGKDNSVFIAENFIKSYSGSIHFVLIHHIHNKGLSAARNTGIKESHGQYVYFLDSDDEITPDCLEKMFSKIEKYGNVDLVQGFSYNTKEQVNTRSVHYDTEYTINRKKIKSFLLTYDGDIIGAQSRLIRKDFLFQYNLFFKEGIIHEDNYWTFFLAKYVTSMAFCPERAYYHRYNPESITGNVNVVKETIAYKTIITDLSRNIDPFMSGRQKELILNTLITALNNHFYENEKDKNNLINTFASQNTFLERVLLVLFFNLKYKVLNTKILHLLIRIYKFKE